MTKGVRLGDIKGLMIEKIIKPLDGNKRNDEEVMKLDFYNQAIEQQSERRLFLSRNKGIKAILKLWEKYDRLNVQVTSKEEAEQIIDALNANLGELLISVEG